MGEWREYYLSELGTLARGKSKHRPRWASHLYGGKYPFIQTGDIAAANKYINNYQQTYSEEGLAQSKLWNEGTLCITIAANIAEIAILKFPACFPDSVLGFITDKGKADLDFIFYTLTYFKNRIKNLAIGSVQDNINLGTFKNIKFKISSLEEQKQIAAVLSCLDAKIDNLRRQNETLEKIAQLLFKRWFIDFEFPNDDGKPYKSSGGEMVASELGEIPVGWRVGEIEYMFDFLEGPGIRNWQYTVSGTRFINIRLIQNGDIEVEKSNFISNEEANGKYAHFHLQENDLVVSTSGTLGRCAIVRKEHLPLLLNTSVIRFRPKHQNDYPFMYQLFKSNYFLRHLKTLASGSVQLNFGPMHLRQINLLIPDRTTLNQFSESTQSIYQKYLLNFKQIQTLTKARDLLLPKLMSGQIRIEEGEEVK